MNRLIKATALGLILSFPVVSHARINVFSVKTPIVKREVSNKLSGGSHISSDKSLINTLVPQKLTSGIQSQGNTVVNERFVVFGVDLNSLNVI